MKISRRKIGRSKSQLKYYKREKLGKKLQYCQDDNFNLKIWKFCSTINVFNISGYIDKKKINNIKREKNEFNSRLGKTALAWK